MREKEKIADIEQDIRDSKDAQSIQKRIKLLSKRNKEMNREMTKYDQDIAELTQTYESKTELLQKQTTRLRSMKQQFAAFQENHDKVLNGWNQKRKDWETQEIEKEDVNKKLLQEIADMTGKVRDQTDILEKLKADNHSLTARLTVLKHKYELSYVVLCIFFMFGLSFINNHASQNKKRLMQQKRNIWSRKRYRMQNMINLRLCLKQNRNNIKTHNVY